MHREQGGQKLRVSSLLSAREVLDAEYLLTKGFSDDRAGLSHDLLKNRIAHDAGGICHLPLIVVPVCGPADLLDLFPKFCAHPIFLEHVWDVCIWNGGMPPGSRDFQIGTHGVPVSHTPIVYPGDQGRPILSPDVAIEAIHKILHEPPHKRMAPWKVENGVIKIQLRVLRGMLPSQIAMSREEQLRGRDDVQINVHASMLPDCSKPQRI